MKPHDGVYARIKPSKIHGIGVFAVRKIKEGTYIFPCDDVEIVWVKKNAIKDLPNGIKRFYMDFCILKDKGKTYGCPKNFNQMTASWYLNHSENPNVGCDENFNFFALREIRNGEELTTDYDTYNEFPNSGSNFKS